MKPIKRRPPRTPMPTKPFNYFGGVDGYEPGGRVGISGYPPGAIIFDEDTPALTEAQRKRVIDWYERTALHENELRRWQNAQRLIAEQYAKLPDRPMTPSELLFFSRGDRALNGGARDNPWGHDGPMLQRAMTTAHWWRGGYREPEDEDDEREYAYNVELYWPDEKILRLSDAEDEPAR